MHTEMEGKTNNRRASLIKAAKKQRVSEIVDHKKMHKMLHGSAKDNDGQEKRVL